MQDMITGRPAVFTFDTFHKPITCIDNMLTKGELATHFNEVIFKLIFVHGRGSSPYKVQRTNQEILRIKLYKEDPNQDR